MSIKVLGLLFLVWNADKLLTNSQFLFCGTENPDNDMDLTNPFEEPKVPSIPHDYGLVRTPTCCRCGSYSISSLNETNYCASNGIHYPNKCTYFCALKSYAIEGQILPLNNSACLYKPFLRTPPKSVNASLMKYNLFAECDICCSCREGELICGDNNLIYKNECYFKCVQKFYKHHNGSLEQVPCTDNHKFYPECDKCCNCPNYTEPVCGTNNVTYPNICEYNCARLYWAGEGLNFSRSEKCHPTDKHGSLELVGDGIFIRCKSAANGSTILEIHGDATYILEDLRSTKKPSSFYLLRSGKELNNGKFFRNAFTVPERVNLTKYFRRRRASENILLTPSRFSRMDHGHKKIIDNGTKLKGYEHLIKNITSIALPKQP